jgi:transcriptional regulator GlxA family with amidase domain
MTLNRVEHALGMMRVYLVECAAQNDWGDHRADELAQTIAACLRQKSEGPRQQAPGQDPKLARDVLRAAITFVNENLDSKLKWDEIASAVSIDPFTFGRGFKLSTGMTPHQYIIRCRLRRAMKLLAREDLNLADIALAVGCSCQSHFTTLFRKHLGTTPGAFRMAARERSQGPVRRPPSIAANVARHIRDTASLALARSANGCEARLVGAAARLQNWT